MRVFVLYNDERTVLDIPQGKTISEVKKIVEDNVYLDSSYYTDDSQSLVLSYAGGVLEDDWIFTDIVLNPGATIRAVITETIFPALKVWCSYNGKTVEIFTEENLVTSPVSVSRALIARRTGIPVGAFFLETLKGKELFDNCELGVYGLKRGEQVNMKSWDGWDKFLRYATLGYNAGVIDELASDEAVARFQMKCAMYIAAHFGHDELAEYLLQQGVKAHEWIGDHPYRKWCKDEEHIDCRRTPVHEAAEFGQLSVLRRFVLDNVFAVTARDGNGTLPLSLSLRNKQKKCAGYLLAKSWSRIEFDTKTIPISLCAKMKFWAERAKEMVWWKMGFEKSSLKKKPFIDMGVLVGMQGVNVDGFPKRDTLIKKEMPGWLKSAVPKGPDPEPYFHKITSEMLIQRMNRTSRLSKNESTDSLQPRASLRSPRARSGDSTTRVRLPAIHESSKYNTTHQNNSSMPRKEVEFSDNLARTQSKDSKATFIQTGFNRSKDNVFDDSKSEPALSRPSSKKRKKKAATIDAPIPLPQISKENKMRPYFHPRSKSEDPMTTLKLYEKYRGMKARDYAIKCLAISNTFKEKPWLKQVRMAMTFAEYGVKRAALDPIKQRKMHGR
ncbi:protein ANKUB1 [Lingula anatina]|uniref:Protein ANKUB1 n=1 Tax=Lingula anatina TaxID=7574 RepID=A0A1S3JA27_LINAN|nr:protein ANKUB1 [Lingula anatina]|eukprot:XP_013407173.1 protein ANKUB1 [Lingula anatina]